MFDTKFPAKFSVQFPTTILGIALLILINGCSSTPKTSRTSKATPPPEGEVWIAADGPGQTETNRARNHRNRSPIQPGMTYDAVVAQFGAPTQWAGQYSWTNLSGKFDVTFNEHNQAMYYNFQSTNAAPTSSSSNTQANWENARSQYENDRNATKEIAQLVQNRASFNSISAHLGGTPTLTSGRGTWQTSGQHYIISFEQGVVRHAMTAHRE